MGAAVDASVPLSPGFGAVDGSPSAVDHVTATCVYEHCRASLSDAEFDEPVRGWRPSLLTAPSFLLPLLFLSDPRVHPAQLARKVAAQSVQQLQAGDVVVIAHGCGSRSWIVDGSQT